MNDDFLYTRQEVPEPAFVAKLQEELERMDSPEKSKRKNGQRRLNWKWKAVAAAIALIVLGVFAWNQPEVQIPVVSMVLGYPADSAFREAQASLGFEIPEMPSGYYLSRVQFSDGDTHSVTLNWRGEGPSGGNPIIPTGTLTAYWATYRGHCGIDFSVDTTVERDEEWYADYYQSLDERSDKVEVIELDGDTIGLWRWQTFDNVAYGMTLEWHHENIRYELEGALESPMGDCISREAFIAIAQSTLDD
jgi:hypothetical protein